MTKRTTTARRAAALGLVAAVGMSGCASLQANPEFEKLPVLAVPTSGDGTTARLGSELEATAALGNVYRGQAKWFGREDRGSGGMVLLSGLYGAAVTAFNPAPKNLKAAILATGAGEAWHTSLKPAERARIYAGGHRAMECAVGAGASLQNYEANQYPVVQGLRTDAGVTLERARTVLAANPNGDKDQRTLLRERIDTLAKLDLKLREEQGAFEDSPLRVSNVRRQVQDAVQARLQGAAPDYAGALKAIGETAKPTGEPAPAADGGGRAPASANKMQLFLDEAASRKAKPLPGLSGAIAEVTETIGTVEAQRPTQAMRAHEALGACIPKAG
ncbi:hypothetical protein [Phenylobacterium kunshanense]|uniref:Lipoprotein n=1 Tax=Phenylobacterium kunshanense TaxID=1445034 RepID=A0A328BSW6_9CAUL|nr:hypothetical protein [Phenylobacterium kunshanense]RAK69096.1 hypothetical protein DJ019_03565 [Phenylobacterium kunshanense]